MIRTHVHLTESQIEGLWRLSAQSGRSIADLVRESIDAMLTARRQPNRQDRVERALRAAGRFRSGASNVSRKHDRHVAEAFAGTS